MTEIYVNLYDCLIETDVYKFRFYIAGDYVSEMVNVYLTPEKKLSDSVSTIYIVHFTRI